MLYHAQNGCLTLDGARMDYVRFGTGEGVLIMLPGLGDGLRTAKGLALPFALMFRMYAGDFTVYAMSRREPLPQGYTTRDMAGDVAKAMELLDVDRACVLGISQGGMIAQHLAADWPERVEKLALAVTMAGQNPLAQSVIGHWAQLAREGDYKGIFIDTAEKSYTEKKLRKYRALYPILTRMGKPKDFTRFLIQANACLTHDARDSLGRISCPTLVVGGEEDAILGAEASRELAQAIPGSRLVMYPGYSHGLYEEAGDFHQRMLAFFKG